MGVVVAPAQHGPVHPHTAGMRRARRDGIEPARGRVGLAVPVVTPTGDRAIDPDRARVPRTGGQRAETAVGRVSPAVSAVAPA